MRPFILLLLLLSLSACVGTPKPPADIARRDLGDPVGPLATGGPAIARVDVRAAAWLETTAQQYRLNYADPLRRQAYAESRWAAPPGELLERLLQRRLGGGAGSACRLTIALDEMEQRFATPTSSAVLIAARASLWPLRGTAALMQRDFRIERAAPSADATGGAQATRAAAQALADDLAGWLAEAGRAQPQLIARCKEPQEEKKP